MANFEIPYSLKESARAKYVRIQVSIAQGVEVIVPIGYDRLEVVKLIHKKQKWLKKTLEKLEHQVKHKADLFDSETAKMPSSIHLKAIAQTWQLEYVQQKVQGFGIREEPNGKLLIIGNVAVEDLESQIWIACLKHWLTQKGEKYLIPWLKRISNQVSLDYGKASIRGQKTLWASCSNDKNISLNYKLLFIEPELVDYVFVHELCHTKQMNHSPAFWHLVEKKMSDCKRRDRQLIPAWQEIPLWA